MCPEMKHISYSSSLMRYDFLMRGQKNILDFFATEAQRTQRRFYIGFFA